MLFRRGGEAPTRRARRRAGRRARGKLASWDIMKVVPQKNKALNVNDNVTISHF